MIFDIEQVSSINVWKQERLIALAEDFDTIKFYTDLEGSAAAPIATYTTPSSRIMYIDVTDYVRANPNVGHLYFYTGDDEFDIAVSVVGLINPANVLTPLKPSGTRTMLVAPPARMLRSAFDYIRIIWEARTSDGSSYDLKYKSGGSTVTQTVSTATCQLPVAAEISCRLDGDDAEREYACYPLLCDVRYAMVRWESFTGATRCHTMEVVKAKSDTKDAFSLLPIDNEYVDIKGREDGFTLHLNGLSAYDLWYYADMIHSSKVEVSLDGETWDRVQVTKKSFTAPDGEGSDGDIEIQVNWKRYDAVAM